MAGSIGQPAIASANRHRGPPPGNADQGKEDSEGTQGTLPHETGRQGQHPEAGQRGPLGNGGMKKVRDPRNSTAAEKVKVFRIGLECEGAAKDPLTYPFKNSYQNLLDGLAKKSLTAALVKMKQRGVLVNDSREVSCSRQREIR